MLPKRGVQMELRLAQLQRAVVKSTFAESLNAELMTGTLEDLIPVVRALFLHPCDAWRPMWDLAHERKLLLLERWLRFHLPPIVEDTNDREEPLGTRKWKASKPSRKAVERYLLDPSEEVTRRILRNPLSTERDIVRLVTHDKTSHAILTEIAASKWLARHHVRRSLVFSRRSHPTIMGPIFPLLQRVELEELRLSAHVATPIKALADEWLSSLVKEG